MGVNAIQCNLLSGGDTQLNIHNQILLMILSPLLKHNENYLSNRTAKKQNIYFGRFTKNRYIGHLQLLSLTAALPMQFAKF